MKDEQGGAWAFAKGYGPQVGDPAQAWVAPEAVPAVPAEEARPWV